MSEGWGYCVGEGGLLLIQLLTHRVESLQSDYTQYPDETTGCQADCGQKRSYRRKTSGG